jgi:two-component system sensor histidine kinase/response regulator
MSGVFDGEEILERVGGDRELLADLVVLLKEECDHLVPAIQEAVEEEDPTVLEQAAHKLKGSVGQMAAGFAYGTARELEHCGRTGEIGSAREPAGRLEAEIVALLEALEAFTAEEAAP